MNAWWQHIPEHIDPIAFSIGFFSVRWYALCFLGGIFSVWAWLRRERRIRKWDISEDSLDGAFLSALAGAFVGARMGYVLWYAPGYFLSHPWMIILPFDPATGQYIGISGMSFHGALVGMAVTLYGWTVFRKQSLPEWMDRVVLAIPLGIIFGRLGNFLNGELWGRSADTLWGMYFPLADKMLRHPSSLYEMIGEGVLLFCIVLFSNRRKKMVPGELTAIFLIGYGGIRFILEYFREPDSGIGYFFGALTLGQIFSIATILSGAIVGRVALRSRKKDGNCAILK